jgi:hypothetical protein
LKVTRLLLLAWCFGSVTGGCESDLKLSLDGLRCSGDFRCAEGYACDKQRDLCVRNVLGDAGISIPEPDASAPTVPGGGAGSGEGGVGGSPGVGGAGGVGGLGAGAGGSAADLDAGLLEPDGGDACVPTTVYRDSDNDGFGDEDTSRVGCPGPGWVVDGTDCRDDIAQVNPGQTGFFGVSYFTPSGPSFDYDCSGAEEPSPNNDTNTPPPDCPALSLLLCEGSGFLPASEPPRNGPGIIDQRCGSTLRRDCQGNGLACESDDTEVAESLKFLCH